MDHTKEKVLISRRSLIQGAVASAFVLASPRLLRAQPSKPIKVGFVAPLTGPYGADARLEVLGAQLAIKQFNESGGLNGRLAELLVRDCRLNAGEGASRAMELIESDQIDIMAGPFGPAAFSINSVIKNKGVPYTPIANSDSINAASEWSKYLFHEGMTPTATAGALARHVVPQGAKRIVMLTAEYVYGQEMAKGFRVAAEALGAEIIGDLRHPLGVNDYSTLFPRILALKPDMLVINNFGRDQQVALKQAQEFGLKSKMKVAVPLMVHTARQVDGHQVYKDVVGCIGYYWGVEDTLPSAARFNAGFRQIAQGVNPSDYAALGYASVVAPLQAARSAGSSEPDAIISTLEKMRYDYYKGPQFYRACDHQSVQSVFIVESKDPREAKSKDDLFKIIGIEEGAEDRLMTCAALGFSS
ncbi:MAG TPA: ABC transporter substrate-binding protein [Eoetvoesiella sp.]